MASVQTLDKQEEFPSDFVFMEDISHRTYPQRELTRVGKFKDTKNQRVCAIKKLFRSNYSVRDIESTIAVLKRLKGLANLFIVKYYSVIQTPEYIYHVMEHLSVGCLRNKINKNHPMKEDHVKFYAACIVLGLEFLHLINIVHGDVGSNNVVLNSYGYAKLVDFDNAKHVPSIYPHLFTDLVGCAETIQDLLIGETLGYVEIKTLGERVSKESRTVLFRLTHSAKSYNKQNCRMCLGNVSDCEFFKGFNWYALREGTLPAPFNEEHVLSKST